MLGLLELVYVGSDNSGRWPVHIASFWWLLSGSAADLRWKRAYLTWLLLIKQIFMSRGTVSSGKRAS